MIWPVRAVRVLFMFRYVVVLLAILAASAATRPLEAAPSGEAAAAIAATIAAFPPVKVTCDPVPEGLDRDPTWTACEQWVWWCIAEGLEANLYAKQCTEPRTTRMRQLRAPWKYAPFIAPDAFREQNRISAGFLRRILTDARFASRIPATGVRIYGAFVEGFLNLENAMTERNLVFDGSVFGEDVRLTNFRATHNISFDGTNVKGSLLLLRANIAGSLFLNRGVYDHVDLRDARIGASVDAADSIFNGLFRMDRAKIDGKIDFERSRLTDWSAVDAEIGGFARFYLADIRARLNLTGAKINGDLRLQRLRFGRWTVVDRRRCDWNLASDKASTFSPEQPFFRAQPALWPLMVEEVAKRRLRGSMLVDTGPSYVCTRKRTPELHELMLREMRIGGTLCLIDVTGLIEEWPPRAGLARVGAPRLLGMVARASPSAHVSKISLDGTDARATVLRWKGTEDGAPLSPTIWRAVNFSAGSLVIDLYGQPSQHFIDNLDMKSITFVQSQMMKGRRAQSVPRGMSEEDDDKAVCDITPNPENVIPADSRDAHDRLVAFFADDARNLSRSAQPLEKVVERLKSSGAASTRIKVALSDYKMKRLCTQSEFFKKWGEEPPMPFWRVPARASAVAGDLLARPTLVGFGERLDEARRIGLDIACVPMLASYKYAVSYGHEPLNIIFVIIVFVVLFWVLLMFDRPMTETPVGRPPKLGILYAIDMFSPFQQVQLNRNHAKWTPNAPWLQAYLKFHRVVGFVLCIILAVGIYSAGR